MDPLAPPGYAYDFVLFLMEKCAVQSIVVKYLVEANLYLAAKLHSESIIFERHYKSP